MNATDVNDEVQKDGALPAPPAIWRQSDGSPVSCQDKIRVLAENYAELCDVMRDAFEDAVLIGVDEDEMRRIISGIVAALRSPRS
ncbi:conserved hypothetical protein [Gluconacetobacter diazotrophicus PA1 5]|uniref:Uncharacterized protein n=2 Tax=Gluconacetobacter diazotrophicus TaxID=33996 RepID=A9HBT7_GLUDA|nr:hypothetical protein [Gluconacetobacter diazotrophicus]ACI50892.1 conserved hypothetical protein [Gluconacetobacter diazotrophicus PA1 5]MBB2156172.1 hypothetical protein [Gluconacetobacter diazotrophicus]TWB08654.1 hypothetical protein FBZ86_106152 [Gluconacetobacter diazotrophicus]CAP54856.1 conserved hypothetical protein [Gluconacetobacter diazotrophicus PA1 5]